LERLEKIFEEIRTYLEAKNAAREEALSRSREIVRLCANSIRAVHRGDFEEATELLDSAKEEARRMAEDSAKYPDIYYSGYTQDALKELAEAQITYSLITKKPLPDPKEIGVEYNPYLRGIGEAVGELRRHVLDLIRLGRVEEGEKMLLIMEEIYGFLIAMDFPEAITGGLRRTTDMVRRILERTRGDLTTAIREERLRRALQEFEEKLINQ
jgi:translin